MVDPIKNVFDIDKAISNYIVRYTVIVNQTIDRPMTADLLQLLNGFMRLFHENIINFFRKMRLHQIILTNDL